MSDTNKIEKELKQFLSDSKKVENKFNKQVESLNLFILKTIHETQSLSRIKKELDIKKSNLSHKLKPLKEQGLIKRVGYGTWELTQKGLLLLHKNNKEISIGKAASQRSISTANKFNKVQNIIDIHVHSFRIKFPILENTSNNDFWDKTSNFSYAGKKKFKYCRNFTIESTGKSIIIHVDFKISLNDPKIFDSKFNQKIYNRFNKAVALLENNEIKIDRTKPSDIMIEYAIQTPLTRELRRLGLAKGCFLDLKRIREKIFERGLEQKAWTKLDQSHPESVETNDSKYTKLFLEMPENIQKMTNSMIGLDQKLVPTLNIVAESNERLSVNLNKHLKVLGEMESTLKLIQQSISRKDKIERLEKNYNRDTSKSPKMIECPLCHASLSEKLLYEREFICPSCHKQLDLYFPFLKKEKEK